MKIYKNYVWIWIGGIKLVLVFDPMTFQCLTVQTVFCLRAMPRRQRLTGERAPAHVLNNAVASTWQAAIKEAIQAKLSRSLSR